MNKAALLGKLPPFANDVKLIARDQRVYDIIKETLAAHKQFAPDYDLIAGEFDRPTVQQIAKALFDFCKGNIRYKVESEARQTTKSPAAILALGDTVGGDCKHYAGFIGGVLDALKRRGKNINWFYRFASYDMFKRSPGHVFVVVQDGTEEIWIDPVLASFNEKVLTPYYYVDKRPKTSNMALYRISGTTADVIDFAMVENVPEESDPSLTPAVENSIRILLQYGIMNAEGKINDSLLKSLSTKVSADEFQQITNARLTIQNAVSSPAAVAGIFDSIWRGVKKVTLALPRNAFLSLVALNVFGFATRLHNAIYKSDGSFFQPNQQKLSDKWYSLGGDWQNLQNAIQSGFPKLAILGSAPGSAVGAAAAAVPAWVATAGAIIAIITPLLKDLLAAKNAAGQLPPGIDPTTGLPFGVNPNMPNISGGTSLFDDPIGWAKENPLLAAGVVFGGYYLYKKI